MALSLAQLTDLLADLDPAGIMGDATPRDEYAAEAAEILTFTNPTAGQIGDVFGVAFGEPGICPRDIAVAILEELKDAERRDRA